MTMERDLGTWLTNGLLTFVELRPTQSSYTVYKESPTSTVSQNILGSLANAGIIIAQIVIVTIIIVVLFKRGHIKVCIESFVFIPCY